MAWNFKKFLSEVGVNITPTGEGNNNTTGLSAEEVKALHDSYKAIKELIDEQNSSLSVYQETIKGLKKELLLVTDNDQERLRLETRINALTIKEIAAKQELEITNKRANDFAIQAAAARGIEAKSLKSLLDNYSEFDNALFESSEQLNAISSSARGMIKGFNSSLGDMGDMIEILKSPISALALFSQAAAKQVVALNEELIKFQRESGGGLNYESIGFDRYGNNREGLKSLSSQASLNAVSESDILASFNAFNQGIGAIGVPNLEGQQEKLQEYGVSIARINKLYGVSSEKTAALGKILTQQYGYGIKETSDILKSGADIAKKAGLNVKNFFDNMQAIADLDVYVKGGADGLSKAAESLTRLGISAQSLQKTSDSYSGLTDLMQKQQNNVALGFKNLAAAQAGIFAKVQTGDVPGAQEKMLIAAAKDITKYLDENNKINVQGRDILKAQGFDKETIEAIERLGLKAKAVGASFEEVVKGNYLSESARRKAARFDQEELTIKEKLAKAWASVKAAIIDPIAQVAGPLLGFVIDTVVVTFQTLNTVLTPVVWLFKKVGDILNTFSANGAVPKILGTILGVLLAWKAWAMAKSLASSFSNVASNFVGGRRGLGKLVRKIPGYNSRVGRAVFGQSKFVGNVATRTVGNQFQGGLLGQGGVVQRAGSATSGFLGRGKGVMGKVGKTLGLGGKGIMGTVGKVAGNLKGGFGAMVLGAGGDWLGDKIKGNSKEGSFRDTVGSAVSGAATGAGIGMMFGPLGAAIGGAIGGLGGIVKSQWGPISKGLSSVGEGVKKVFSKPSSLLNLLNPISAIVTLVKGIRDDGKKKELDIKTSSLSASTTRLPEIQKIMEGKKMDTELMEKSGKENMINSQVQPNVIVNTYIKSDIGGLKTRLSGHG